MSRSASAGAALLVSILLLAWALPAGAKGLKEKVFDPGRLAAVDSRLKVRVGMPAPEFSLPAIDGSQVSPGQFKGVKNVVISFVPAAWTPVCSEQWPGYNLAEEEFAARDAVLLGLTVDNLPTLFAWTEDMGGLWFPVLSDFWPHGAVADRFGVLRSDGTAERALIVIDKQGIIRYIDVHDVNQRPELGALMAELDKLK